MPIYDYRCERCSAQFEIRQSFSDDTLTLCPPTGGPSACEAPGEGAVKKVFSGVAIAFKGDGFYKNDHGANAKSRRKEASASESSSSKDSPSGDSSSEGSSSGSSSSKDSGSGSGAGSSSSDSSGGSSSSGSAPKAGASTSAS